MGKSNARKTESCKPTEACKLIDGDFNYTHTLKVYREVDWEEFIAAVYCKENGNLVSSYHTDDKEDAKRTGRTQLAEAAKHNWTKQVKEV